MSHTRHKDIYDMGNEVIDLDSAEVLVRALYQGRILEDPTTDATKLDLSFFDNSAVDFSYFQSNIRYGQKLQYYIHEDVKPLDNFESKALTYKDEITCGGQLDLDCAMPCGGNVSSYRTDEFILDKEYFAMAQICWKTEQFRPGVANDSFMGNFQKSFEAAKFGYALDMWNKVVEQGIATKQKTVDTRLAKALEGKLATHFWDLTGLGEKALTDGQVLSAINKAVNYLSMNFKGTFQPFVTSEVAQIVDRYIATSGAHDKLGASLAGVALGSDYHGMQIVKNLPGILSNTTLNVMPFHSDFMKGKDNKHPLYTPDGENMYILVASRDAFAHFSIDGIEWRNKEDCNAIEKITKNFYAGGKTVFPEKVIVIKLPRPAFEFEDNIFCC